MFLWYDICILKYKILNMNRIDNFLLLSLVLTLFVCDLKSQVVASDDVYLCEGEQGNVEVILSATSFAVDLND